MLTDQRWDLAPGAQVAPGRHVLEPLGRGERYQTYLAFDDRLLTLVVVKVLRADRRTDPRALRGLRAEARILEAVQHPVIVRSFGAQTEGACPHLVLEHLEGPPLSTLLRRHGPLPLAQLVPLTLQLEAALHYLRAAGAVHLDVKPRNIIMGAPPRLIDLSVARTVEDAARLDHPVGTDAYMAPEQCDPAAWGPVGVEADVWGLGVTLYEALAGRRPWPDDDKVVDRRSRSAACFVEPGSTKFPQLVADPEPLPPDLPAVLVDVVLACLQREAVARPAPRTIIDAVEPLVAAIPRRPVLSRLRPRFRLAGR